ncbi:MAG TPA: TolC family protein [Pyrinomonadaceae bacterium]|nr:TolC family protein [Pyrinomonadaceae bacterium]
MSSAPAAWAQTQGTTTQTPAPTTTPSSPAVPLGGRQGGERDAGSAATSAASQAASAQFLDPTGLTVERLVATGFERRADLLAARQRLAVAEGRLIQAGLRPNPTLDAEYSQARFLGGQNEGDTSVGLSQVFETGGKRSKRIAVARAELEQVRAEVLSLERQFAADVRASYARAVAAARQLDVLEQLIATNEELVRVTNARLKEGDVAPLDVNLVTVETDRLRAQVIKTRADLEGVLISLRALVGFETVEPLRLAPLPERPPRLDLSVTELTDIALRERADLQAARRAEEAGAARIQLARSLATPNVALSAKYSSKRDVFDDTPVGVLSDKDRILSFGVSVDIPIFNKNQGEIASAVGERAQAQRQREFLEATIRRDVALAYRRYRAAAEAVVLYATRILPASQSNLRSVRAAYGLGEFSTFDVINEQRRLIESQTGYNDAVRDYYDALADLERALGTPLPATGFAPGSASVLPDPEMLDGRVRRTSGAPSSPVRSPDATPDPTPVGSAVQGKAQPKTAAASSTGSAGSSKPD